MSLLTKAKKVVGRILGDKEMVEKATRDEQDQDLVEKWKGIFESDKQAKKEWDGYFDLWEEMYQGGRDFNNVDTEADSREMRTNVNFPRMITESLVDLSVPDPEFKPVAKDDEEPIQMLEDYVKYVVRAGKPSLKEINLHNERRVLKFGGAFWKVHWDNNVRKAGYVGEISISMPHPKDVIPNSSATSIDDMNHYHHVVNRTAKEITRRWKDITVDDLESYGTLYHEYDEVSGSQRITISGRNHEQTDKDIGLQKYSVVETTYRDDDGDIGKLWWTGDLILRHLPKFFYRRGDDGEIMETESYDGMEAEYYVPKSWDLVYQPFIPRDKCFWGISLMEDIFDLNEAIKKAVFIHEEQHLKGTKKIIVGSQGLKIALETSTSTVEYVPDPQTMVKEIDMRTDLDGIQWIEKLKEWMQLMTGATNTALGVRDSSVNSAKQAQVYIEQANFKVSLKTAYKSACYERLYRVIADFALAFIDEKRPFRLVGVTPKPIQNPDGTLTVPKALYGEFNRLSMLKDKSGNYIYPDYDIDVEAEPVFLKSKSEMFNAFVTLAGQGRFEATPGNVAFLKVLKKIGVPDLQEIIDSMEAEIKQQKEIAMMNAQGKQEKPPAGSIAFKDLPPMGKAQLAAKAGIQLNPQDIVQDEQADLDARLQLAFAQSRYPQQQSAQGKTQQQQSDTQSQVQAGGQQQSQQITLEQILSQLSPEELKIIKDNPQILLEALGGEQAL